MDQSEPLQIPAQAAQLADRAAGPWRAWALVLVLLAAATAIGLVLEDHISITSQAMVYVLAVVIAAYRLEWQQSVVSAVGAVTALNFFFVPPRLTFEVESREHLIALASMLVVAMVISHLAARLRQEARHASQSENRARQLQALASSLASADSEGDMLALGQAALNSAYAGPIQLLLAESEPGAEPGPQPATGSSGIAFKGGEKLGQAALDGLRCCLAESAVLGPGTGRWPGLNAWYFPLGDKGRVLGAASVEPALAADVDGREHAQALCNILAQGLWRLRLAAKAQAAKNEAQRQQIQSTFLAAVSHDLRTPLAAIVGAASALQTQADKLSPAEQQRLLAGIVAEAAYLSELTENTLQLLQLNNAATSMRRDWESMQEVAGAVLMRLRQRDPERRIKSSIDAALPLVRANPVLMAQLLSNLLDNALKYSAGEIGLAITADGRSLRIAVSDRGPGISESDQATMYEPYRRGDQQGQHGAGLGLALCRAIALAHGGTLSYRRRQSGGSCFTVALPVEVQPTAGDAT